MRRQRSAAQMKEQTRNTKVQINEEKIGKLPGKEFREMTVKMMQNLNSNEKRMQAQTEKLQEMFDKEKI